VNDKVLVLIAEIILVSYKPTLELFADVPIRLMIRTLSPIAKPVGVAETTRVPLPADVLTVEEKLTASAAEPARVVPHFVVFKLIDTAPVVQVPSRPSPVGPV
jgi:hypothetical protein